MVGIDARIEKTREALYSEILRMARTRSVTSLSVSGVAEAVGISRATFYRHAASPTSALVAALREKLDTIRNDLLDGAPTGIPLPAAGLRGTLERVVAHVAEYAQIYGPALNDGVAPAVRDMLIQHLIVSVDRSQRITGDAFWPSSSPVVSEAEARVRRQVTASGFAHLLVGVLGPWLQHDQQRDPARFVALFEVVAPHWWSSATRIDPDPTRPLPRASSAAAGAAEFLGAPAHGGQS